MVCRSFSDPAMSDKLYYYISPWLFPVMPETSGRTVVSLDFQALLYDAVPDLNDNDGLILTFDLWHEGELQNSETVKMCVENGIVTPRFVTREYALPGFGYLHMTLDSETPYFRKIEFEKGYGLLMRPAGGATTVLPQAKYAVSVIVDNIRGTGTFCLVHPAHHMDTSKDITDSALLLNPYDGPLVAILQNQDGKRIKERIPSGCARLISLEPLLKENKQACIMYSGTNRYPGWDVRHSRSNPENIYNMDHLEYYRSDKAYKKLASSFRMKSAGKRLLRSVGYIC